MLCPHTSVLYSWDYVEGNLGGCGLPTCSPWCLSNRKIVGVMGGAQCWLCCQEALGVSFLTWSPSLFLCCGLPSGTSRTIGCLPSQLQPPLCLGLLNPGHILSSAPQRVAEHTISGLTLESVTVSSVCMVRSSPDLSFLIHKMEIKRVIHFCSDN